MSELFIRDKIIIDSSVLSTDSTLIKTKGCVWHKSSIKKKVVSRSGIDIYRYNVAIQPYKGSDICLDINYI